ncbi:MAG TPA: ABC transporter permease [Acidimicrobiia bacterium]|nr:ABC transporter permease [Acidimicrobiia bacterium]
MSWIDTLRSAWDVVRTHRLRSALTMLGILIGITSVVLTVGIGAGAQAEVRDSINALGTNLLVVTPGSSTDSSGIRGGFGTASTLTIQDAEALDSEEVAPDVQTVAAVSTTQGSFVAGDTNWTSTLTGTTPSWQEVRSRGLESGRFITGDDTTVSAAVAVVGSETAEELFGTTDVVGETLFYDSTQLEIIGVLETVDSSAEATSNDLVIVPLSTYNQRLIGGSDRNSVDSIYVKATSSETLAAAYQQAYNLFVNLHGTDDAEDVDFSIATEESILQAATSIDDTLTVMLSGISVISLLVGGIGVMNIMLVSVTERIREIGLRKAVGGRPALIRRQFLVEASMLGLFGGVLGVAVGLAGAVAIPAITDTRIVVPVTAAAIAIATAVLVGVIFGVYPASRAARLTPIDALRSE